MRVLIDMLHPAHVHFFRHFIVEATNSGHQLCVVSRDKDVTVSLLDAFEIPHVTISSKARGVAGLAREWLHRTRSLLRVVRDFKPDVMTGIMGVSIAPVGRLLGIPAVVFYDTEVARFTNHVVFPLAHKVVTPDCYEGHVRGRHISYAGYHELAYLHPSRFRPDPSKLKLFSLDPSSVYTLVRFVSWESSHDLGRETMTLRQKNSVIQQLSQVGRVLISSEEAVPERWRDLVIDGPNHELHHVVAHAALLVGDSATMASESAMLGVPAVYVGQDSRGYINDIEARYGLVNWVKPKQDAVDSAIQRLMSIGSAERQLSRSRMLEEKVDVTSVIASEVIDNF